MIYRASIAGCTIEININVEMNSVNLLGGGWQVEADQ